APLPSLSADALGARAQWTQSGGVTLETLPQTQAFDLVIDALLGIGAQRPLADPFLAALRWVRTQGIPVFALDVPSGLNADTGAWVGGVAGAPARRTITFIGDKPGLHTLDGLQAAGEVCVEVLGLEQAIGAAVQAGQLITPRLFSSLLQPRPSNCNKGDFGSVAVIGGARGMVGAALLAARAAIRLGAGKVYVDCIGAPDLDIDWLQPELMCRSENELPHVGILVVGCGMGTDAPARGRLERVLRHPGPVVCDADALNCLATDSSLSARLRARNALTVLTPHPGEAARLLGTDAGAVQQDRVAHALRLAQLYQAVVVLKGAGTVVAEPSALYSINPTGGPALASAGTGDVLAGMIGALLAQCTDGVAAVRASVWLHGRAAELFGADLGLAASEVAPLAARALAQLRGAHQGASSY
ncbi:MAG TPA: NAD(P)H-hydrate dehydratase, partial [Burkholderiaceae bacterium]|nr:NAD(P)H-hydrate dehydratase [Burkholderiaceae bacterium]